MSDYVKKLVEEGLRSDGRGFEDFREIKIEKNVIKTAEGSARVKIGNSDVLVGIKLSVGEPFPDTPDEGILIVNTELVPVASPTFEPGPP
ncbi:MAG: RNA-binding protein, partial [Candidatus Aminicenantia bacterium]